MPCSLTFTPGSFFSKSSTENSVLSEKDFTSYSVVSRRATTGGGCPDHDFLEGGAGEHEILHRWEPLAGQPDRASAVAQPASGEDDGVAVSGFDVDLVAALTVGAGVGDHLLVVATGGDHAGEGYGLTSGVADVAGEGLAGEGGGEEKSEEVGEGSHG